MVGQSACVRGFVWDELFRKCHPVFTCEAGARYRSGQCPGEETENLVEPRCINNSSCDRLVLGPQEFTLLDNGSLLMGASGDILDQDRFKVIEDNVEVKIE